MTSLQKLAMLTVATTLLSPWPGFAQSAGNPVATGRAARPGDAAVSPSGNAPTSSAKPGERPSAGVNSGVLNNGTTGDTIGTGHGTSTDSGTASGSR